MFEPAVEIKQKAVAVIDPEVEKFVPSLGTIKVAAIEIFQGGGQDTSD